MIGSLVLCHAVYFHYAIERQHAPGYNAKAGQFLLAAVLPIVSRDDVQPYIDPSRTPAIVDDHARDRRALPQELFQPGLAVDQIHQASENLRAESRLGAASLLTRSSEIQLGFSTWLGRPISIILMSGSCTAASWTRLESGNSSRTNCRILPSITFTTS